MTEQIDISYAQGVVSVAQFQAYKAAGVDRIGIRASRSDSALAQDSVYRANAANARAAGLPLNHYHFNGNAATPQNAAAFMLSHITVGPNDWITLDVETEGGVTQRWSDAQAAAFLHAVKAAHPSARLFTYMSQSVTSAYPQCAALSELWVASYTTNLGPIAPWKAWSLWQYTDAGHAAVLGRGVDTSRYNPAVTTAHPTPAQSTTNTTPTPTAAPTNTLVGDTVATKLVTLAAPSNGTQVWLFNPDTLLKAGPLSDTEVQFHENIGVAWQAKGAQAPVILSHYRLATA